MEVNKKANNPIVNMTFEFAKQVIVFAHQLEDEKKYVIARQLFRSGTSIGANIREAQNAESKADFIHKFKISAKEADETQYWLELCIAVYEKEGAKKLLMALEDIMKVINKIVATSKLNYNKK
jgi:four helix bundle protein